MVVSQLTYNDEFPVIGRRNWHIFAWQSRRVQRKIADRDEAVTDNFYIHCP